MRIRDLKIKNIGPFRNSEINFISDENDLDYPPVVIITGENGTGKSIILDAIRSLYMGVFENVEREITSSEDFEISMKITLNKNKKLDITSKSKNDRNHFVTNHTELSQLFRSQFSSEFKKDFIFDYWTSKLSNDNFTINNVEILSAKKYLDEVLKGIHKNIDVSRSITFFDYLRDSKDSKEKELGEILFSILEQIVNSCIANGHLSHVSRINLTPLVYVQGREISLDKLSSGNLYLIQRLISLLRQVYSICVLNNLPIEEYKKIEGVLLIDEAENHLHPKWQKTLLGNILKFFPNLQIIVTTHSPFVISSVERARIFVCTDNVDHSIITEETDFYANSPIEEILRSPLFNTTSFNEEISDLLVQRKEAIKNHQTESIKEIENKLLAINPEYFNYLNLEEVLRNLKK